MNGSHSIEKTENIQQSSVQVDAEIIAQTEVISGVTAIKEESTSAPTKLRPSTYSISNKSDIEVVKNHVTRKKENSSPSSFSSTKDRFSNTAKQSI
ncbi:hypothetical protein [Sporosarcina sp. P1]|uniref:hypothetical protein n=1 Tax=Sporosarcina sp. P1 TaxID=2048257 RepID=UPI000C164C4B|nr:hypothetical protein [Sporosarcina sp. P1]PIC83302.1 hypothetical protein CSV73_08615 [Sporosarcina sp. P1]